ncbi:citrate synthase family protein [Acidimangrovimonas sediminis]|uniref:citrate synthase family protein n=1 Tax=Acidimangrovimonas sediminis TaxID=2056283 RepID=UPI000C7F7AF0|nr:citrate synthase family protein [Acidimangrovimonas sediminis]
MTREEAIEALGVRQQTLYAYVSRKLIGVRPASDGTRRNLYRGEDIAELLARRDTGRARQRIASSTMAWGEPIIETRISTIVHGRLYYRGEDAVLMSRHANFEEAAALLWESPAPPDFGAEQPPGDSAIAIAEPAPGPRHRAYIALGLRAASGMPAHTLSPAAMLREAAALVGTLAANLVPGLDPALPMHDALAQAWGRPEAADLLRRTLVQLADQELTSSAFAARVTASTGASLGAAAVAGFAALSGPLHGDATVRVQALVEDAQRIGPEAALRRWSATAAPLPGFGHKLYPEGDPRAAELLSRFDPPPEIAALIAHVRSVAALEPTIDVALAALASHSDLPEGSAFALFAIARSAGWMAHAIEQITSGSLLRPRATYIGPGIVETEIAETEIAETGIPNDSP